MQFSMRQIGVIIGFLATVVVNALATILPINGVTTAEVAARYSTYFVPAGYVFSIWGVIYLLLAGFAWYQLMPKQAHNKMVSTTAYYFLLTCLGNISWLLFWHYGYLVLSMVAMVFLLFVLIKGYQYITSTELATRDALFVKLPFSVYLGWISVATIANASAVLYSYNWSGFGVSPEWWATILVLVVGVLTSAMLLLKHDYAYYSVIVWALLGLLIKFPTVEPLNGSIILCLTVLSIVAGIQHAAFRIKRKVLF